MPNRDQMWGPMSLLVGTGVGVLGGPLAPLTIPLGAAAGGWAAGKLMEKTTNEAVGRKLHSAGEAYGRYPYYDGGVGWPIFPSR